MAQLGGKNVRTLLTSLEVLSDDGKTVLMLDSKDGLGGGGVVIKTRKPFESTYNYELPTWTISKQDADILTKVIINGDISYITERVASINSSDFTAEDINGAAVEKEVEARCSQLDIERAKAANIEEEKDLLAKTLIVQHMDDKHVSISVDGCRYCEAAIANATRSYSPMISGLPYDPDDDSTKIPERGYGEDMPF